MSEIHQAVSMSTPKSTLQTLYHLQTLGRLRDQLCTEAHLHEPALRPLTVKVPDRIDPKVVREKLTKQIEALNFAIKHLKQ